MGRFGAFWAVVLLLGTVETARLDYGIPRVSTSASVQTSVVAMVLSTLRSAGFWPLGLVATWATVLLLVFVSQRCLEFGRYSVLGLDAVSAIGVRASWAHRPSA
jgi:hypothetical protein